jgi:hypothetical protein
MVVGLQEITALARRHLIAILLIGGVAAGVAYSMKHTPPIYQEGCTIVLTAPISAVNPNPYGAFSGSMTETAGTIALLVMSPHGHGQVRASGGNANYDVSLVNFGNLSSPIFGAPTVTVTATSQDPNNVHHTFTVVTRFFEHELVIRQAMAGVRPVGRIGAHVVGDTGIGLVQGSSKRVYAGLLVLTIAAALSVSFFLDRHPVRLSLPRLRSARGGGTIRRSV